MLIDNSFVKANTESKITQLENGCIIEHSTGKIMDSNKNQIGVVVRYGDQWQINILPLDRKTISHEERFRDVPKPPPIDEIIFMMRMNQKKKI